MPTAVIRIDTRRVLPMILLRSYEHYVRWSNGRTSSHSGWGYAPYRDSPRHVRERRKSELQHMAPAEFPCMAMVVMTDHRMEENEPFYLYGTDLQRMLAGLVKEAKAQR